MPNRNGNIQRRIAWGLEKNNGGPYLQGGNRSLVTNYRPVSLTSVVFKQMELIIASYLRQVWEINDWLYEGQHGFRPKYSCESPVITVCQDIADSVDNGERMDALWLIFRKLST